MTRLRGLLCTLEMYRKLGCRPKSVVQRHACYRGVWGTPPGEVHLDVRPNACQHLGRCIIKLHPGPRKRVAKWVFRQSMSSSITGHQHIGCHHMITCSLENWIPLPSLLRLRHLSIPLTSYCTFDMVFFNILYRSKHFEIIVSLWTSAYRTTFGNNLKPLYNILKIWK